MKITIAALALIFVLSPIAAVAADVTCPIHEYATCWDTFQTTPSGAHKWHCTCGDDVWVK